MYFSFLENVDENLGALTGRVEVRALDWIDELEVEGRKELEELEEEGRLELEVEGRLRKDLIDNHQPDVIIGGFFGKKDKIFVVRNFFSLFLSFSENVT